MTIYQTCHTHYGYLTRETAIARELLERHGKPNPQTVKELNYKTDMPMAECARMLLCMWRDMELEQLQSENSKLRDLVRKLYGGYMISCNGCEYAYEDDGGYTPLDPDCCVFSFSDRYVGCWKRKRLEAEMRELGVEVN